MDRLKCIGKLQPAETDLSIVEQESVLCLTFAMTQKDTQNTLKFARDLAAKAGEIQWSGHTEGFQQSSKISDVDIVTDIDKRCEELIVSALEKEYPDFGILGEEGTDRSGKDESPYRWIIDPLDGTTNYIHNFPVYSVSIALFDQDTPLLGVVHSAPLRRTYTAIRGQGSFLNGEKIHTSGTRELSKALVATGVPYDRATSRENNVNYISHVIPQVQGLRRTGAVSIDTALVGQGVLDGYLELKIRLWDFAAGILIAREAGAVGSYVHIGDDYYNVVCAAPAIYPILIGKLHEIGDSFSTIS